MAADTLRERYGVPAFKPTAVAALDTLRGRYGVLPAAIEEREDGVGSQRDGTGVESQSDGDDALGEPAREAAAGEAAAGEAAAGEAEAESPPAAAINSSSRPTKTVVVVGGFKRS